MDNLELDFLFDLGGHAMTSLAIVGEQSFHCYSIDREQRRQVDRPLRRAMLQVSGFAAILASSKGLLDPPISISSRARLRVFGNADHSGADRTLDRDGAARE